MHSARGASASRQQDQGCLEANFEISLQDLEEDPELRSTLALYEANSDQRNRGRADKVGGLEGAPSGDGVIMNDGLETDDELSGIITRNALLDEFDELNVND
jgi:nonsense-mediated mRNA decay protein 3